jgi:hypothetical protein
MEGENVTSLRTGEIPPEMLKTILMCFSRNLPEASTLRGLKRKTYRTSINNIKIIMPHLG